MNVRPPTIIHHGMHAEHDMPCAVCIVGHAVLHLGSGIFDPCWDCQRDGWRLVNPPPSWWRRLLARWKQRKVIAK